MNRIILLFLAASLLACGQSDEGKLESGIRAAKHYLTVGKCSKAREALLDSGSHWDDPGFVKLLSSSYACESDYNELDLFEELEDLPSEADQFLAALAQLTTSNETKPESANYQNLGKAIETVLNSGGGRAAGRYSKFGKLEGSSLNFQGLYMILVQLGKFVDYYGNNGGGFKGGGSGPNSCFINYTVATAQSYIDDGRGGACVLADPGHPELPGPVNQEKTRQRLCEGIYLLNHMRDILVNADFGSGSAFERLKDFGNAMELAIDAAELYSPTVVSEVRNVYEKSRCLKLSQEQLEVWYALVFETAFP